MCSAAARNQDPNSQKTPSSLMTPKYCTKVHGSDTTVPCIQSIKTPTPRLRERPPLGSLPEPFFPAGRLIYGVRWTDRFHRLKNRRCTVSAERCSAARRPKSTMYGKAAASIRVDEPGADSSRSTRRYRSRDAEPVRGKRAEGAADSRPQRKDQTARDAAAGRERPMIDGEPEHREGGDHRGDSQRRELKRSETGGR